MSLLGSIGLKILAMMVLAVAVVAAIGGTGWSSARDLDAAVRQMGVVQQALHNQSEIDGANHAVRYDLVALVSGLSATDRAGLLEDLDERVSTLRDSTATNRVLLADGGSAVDAAFAAVDVLPRTWRRRRRARPPRSPD